MLAGVALGALMFAAPAQAQDLKEINIMVPNNNTTTLYPVIVARDLGWFEKAGLKVNYLDSNVNVPYVAFLSNGQADAVMLDANETFQALNAKQPINVVYEAMQNAPEVLAVPVDGPIQTLEGLKGKKIGLASDRDQATVQIVLDSAGMTIDDVETVEVGDSGPVVASALKNNEIDAYAAAINDITLVGANGIPMKDLTPPAIKVNPANTYSVWVPTMEEKRDILQTFFKVWAMAAKAGKIDPETVAKMCQKAVPEEWEIMETGEALYQGSLGLHTPATPLYGQVQPDVWARVQGSLVKFKLLDNALDPATFLNDSFIEAANDIDDAQIKADLDAWKAANP
jgi:NitT/TauT family transport system substrate-binding protein